MTATPFRLGGRKPVEETEQTNGKLQLSLQLLRWFSRFCRRMGKVSGSPAYPRGGGALCQPRRSFLREKCPLQNRCLFLQRQALEYGRFFLHVRTLEYRSFLL